MPTKTIGMTTVAVLTISVTTWCVFMSVSIYNTYTKVQENNRIYTGRAYDDSYYNNIIYGRN